MYRRHGQKLVFFFLAADLAITAGSWLGGYWLRCALWPTPLGVPPVELVLAGLPLVLALAVVAYRLCGLYEVHRLRSLPRELGVVCQSSGLLFVLCITFLFYRRDLYESRLALAIFPVLNVIGLAAGRRCVWWIVKCFRNRGLNYGRALIVGVGRTGRLVAQTIKNNRWTGLEAVGFVDKPGRVEPTMLPRLGTIDRLAQIARHQRIDHVFVALPLSRYGELPQIYRWLADVLVEVHLVPDLPSLAGMKIRSLEVDDVSFLSLRGNPHYGWGRVAKRSMDLVLSSLALVIFSPFLIGLAILVKLTSRGPVLYSQPRMGLGGRAFRMLKFRSMRTDAELKTGPVWARKYDDRCTPLGRFMRRWSLDELPQLLNVLVGDMSLVGPRPERGVFVERFRRQIPNYCQRHQVKAGITGWAQVNGWRGNTSLRRRIECDLYYISNWSLALDLQILVMTVWAGFRHRHAY